MSVYSIGQPKTKSLRELFPFIHFSGPVKEVTCRKGIVYGVVPFFISNFFTSSYGQIEKSQNFLISVNTNFLFSKSKFSWIFGILLFHFSIHLPKIFSLNKSGVRSIVGVGSPIPESRSNGWLAVWGRDGGDEDSSKEWQALGKGIYMYISDSRSFIPSENGKNQRNGDMSTDCCTYVSVILIIYLSFCWGKFGKIKRGNKSYNINNTL